MRSHSLKKVTLTRNLVMSGVIFAIVISFSTSSQARPWNDHLTRLALLAKQMELKEAEIGDLVAAKSQTHDRRQIAEQMQQIADLHRELVEINKEYEEEKQHVRFEHPERSNRIERTYSRHKVKTIDEMESEFGIDSRLDRLKERVLATFPVSSLTKPKTPVVEANRVYNRKPASVEAELPERIHLKR